MQCLAGEVTRRFVRREPPFESPFPCSEVSGFAAAWQQAAALTVELVATGVDRTTVIDALNQIVNKELERDHSSGRQPATPEDTWSPAGDRALGATACRLEVAA